MPIVPAQLDETRDVLLVESALSGSREAFGLLVVRHSRAVRAACLARLGLRSDLDDMVQETFLRAFKGLQRLKNKTRFGAYAHRIAHNICVDKLRRNREEVSLHEVDLEPPPSIRGPGDEKEERMAHLRQLVGQLAPALREAVLLFYFEKLSHARIAEMLGVSQAAVNQRLHRARASLRESFGVGLEKES